MEGSLVLEDGTVARGPFFGARRRILGELVFNTNMTGYTEALTDPSYRGQILMMTYPLIGNYGVDPDTMESDTIQPTGFVVKEACATPSHPRSAMGLGDFLKRHETPAIEGADTRALTIRIRSKGTMKAALVPADEDVDEVAKEVRAAPHPDIVATSVRTTRELAGRVPLLGICLGHQLLALAFGGKTFKLKFGHRGGNQPVKDLRTGRVHITSQNHGFAVDATSLPESEFEVTHVNLNDGTVEGMAHREMPIFSVQYHPEAHPGPWDNEYIFQDFVAELKGA